MTMNLSKYADIRTNTKTNQNRQKRSERKKKEKNMLFVRCLVSHVMCKHDLNKPPTRAPN